MSDTHGQGASIKKYNTASYRHDGDNRHHHRNRDVRFVAPLVARRQVYSNPRAL